MSKRNLNFFKKSASSLTSYTDSSDPCFYTEMRRWFPEQQSGNSLMHTDLPNLLEFFTVMRLY